MPAPHAPDAPAPDFAVPADDGSIVTLASLRGRPAVLYFYPRDNTPGCTLQACEFRDAFPRFAIGGATILGISPDSVESHARFKAKYALPFTLLADEDHRMAEAYGVWKQKSMFGKKYMGVERTTFVLDAEGRVVTIFPKVNPLGHAAKVEAVLQRLMDGRK